MPQRRQFGITRLLSLLIVLLLLSYPFLVSLYIEEISPRWFAFALLGVAALRLLFLGKSKQISDYLILGFISLFCLIIIIFESEQILKFYPVLMNFGMGLLFIFSLLGDQSLIEKFARAGGKSPPPQALGYLRTLSLLWGLLLIINGVISAYTACYTSLSFWALYNGFLSYLFIAIFAAGEYVYRGYYKKRHNIVDDYH